MGLSTILTASLLTLRLFGLPTAAAPAPQAGSPGASTSSYWVETIARQGAPAFGTNAGYKVFRNVKEFGAKGDGSTDDTEAINRAISDGSRCGQGCDSSTTTPAMVYFPAGTYMVSKPIIQFYYTQLVGDAGQLPTIKALASFEGMAVIDADPYDDQGNNWWVNQNNFFRQIRNFKIDLTQMPPEKGAGIHWQVAQATSLQNIEFNMRADGGTKQMGIFMDNGSGGFMADLTFIGGQYGAFLGSQQFTTRNLTFRGCQTAIFMNWNWAWTFQDVKIQDCGVGIDMSNGGASQTVGSVLLLDSTVSAKVGVLTAFDKGSPETNGTLIIENTDMTGTGVAVQSNTTSTALLAGGAKVDSWIQGRSPASSSTVGSSAAVQGPQTGVTKPQNLLSGGKLFTRIKPQYENVPAANFVSVKSQGAKGDGKTDDTAAIQKALDSATADQIVYFDHGAYLVTDTIKVPKNIKITGEVWPLIMAGGNSAFSSQDSPKPVFQVGQPGDTGAVEMSDLMFETRGPQPGAIMIEWNVNESSQGAAGMWDVHVRIGGSAGTNLQLSQCAKNPNVTQAARPECFGAFMMMHITKSASAYVENCWFWVADHDLEPEATNQQIDIFSGRGVLIEAQQGPVIMLGTASEHSVLYNYQLVNASNVYMGLIQTETPYFQGNPDANTPFKVNAAISDPDFSTCQGPACARAWGLRAVSSKDVFVYGAGLYSFFDNYGQECVAANNCQEHMVSLESSDVHMFGLSTKASVNMLTVDGSSRALDSDNRNNFCATLAFFSSGGGQSPPIQQQGGGGTATSGDSTTVITTTVRATQTVHAKRPTAV